MPSFIQRSFAAGEIAPSLQGRADQVKYRTGLKTCLNWIVQKFGGVTNRQGFGLVTEARDSSKAIRQIPFIFNDDNTYVLEFGDLYMRVIKNGAQLREVGVAISAITNASPGQVTTGAAHGYATGDQVVFVGVGGMTELNGNRYTITVVDATNFTIGVDTTLYGVYTAGGTSERIYQITTPYLEAELFDLKFAQSADVVTIVHQNHPPQDLTRTGDISWALTEIAFGPDIPFPLDVGSSLGGAGANTYRYRVTAIDRDTLEESYPSVYKPVIEPTIASITIAPPAEVQVTLGGAPPFGVGDEIYIFGVIGTTQINDRHFKVSAVAGNTFDILDEDGTGWDAYVSGGFARATYFELLNAAVPTAVAPNIVRCANVTNASHYNVYREDNRSGLYGFIGSFDGPAGVLFGNPFNDIGYTPDTNNGPPIPVQPFENPGDYPSTVAYVQQRRGYGNSNNNPSRTWLSRIGRFSSFGLSDPLQADDRIIFEVAGGQVDEVRNLSEVAGRLLTLTSGGEWTIEGGADGVLTPTTLHPRQWGYSGSARISPIPIGDAALYVQARGRIIRDIRFRIESDGYAGRDLTIFSPHMFKSPTQDVVSWAYQETPNSVLWAVKADGTISALTYLPEHDIWGWHRHETDGLFEDVVVVPEGGVDSVYVVVNRTINGTTRRYIERMPDRLINDLRVDAKFLDSHLTYDGRNLTLAGADPTATMELTAPGGDPLDWAEGVDINCECSEDTFRDPIDEGNAVHVGTPGSEDYARIVLHTITDAKNAIGRADRAVGAAIAGVEVAIGGTGPTTTWALAVDEVAGLLHLEDEDVGVLADGFVLNEETVASGAITLDQPYAVICVGLPIVADMETLDPERLDDETLADKKKRVNRLSMWVDETSGIKAGMDEDHLHDIFNRSTETYDVPDDLKTDIVELHLDAEWSEHANILVRQDRPLPATIMDTIPTGFVGG